MAASPHTSAASTSARAGDTPAGPRPRVLIVDDQPRNLEAMAAVIEPLGAEVVRAHSAEEALRQVLVQDFAVVLLDVQMPDIDGFEAARLIRSRERSRAVPIVFATALDRDRRHDLAGYAAGAVDFLYKPLDPDILRAKIATFLEIDRLRSSTRLAEQLRASEHRAEAIVAASLDGVVSVDHEGRILEFNPAAERAFGYRRDEVIGRPFAEVIIPPEQRESFGASVGRYMRSGDAHLMGQRLELPAMRADGSTFLAEVAVVRMPMAGAPTYTAFLRDVTEVRRSAEHTRRLQEITAALSRALTPEEVAAAIVEHGVAALGAQAGSIFGLLDDGRTLEMLGSTGYPPEVVAQWRVISLDTPIPLATAAREAVPIFIESEASWQSRFARAGPLRALPESRAWAALPLAVGDRVLGAMGLSFGESKVDALDESSRSFILALAQQCAQAFDRARLHAAERAARLEAERARADAEIANEAKSAFLATMSHELRTPLNAIQGYTQLLEIGLAGPVTEQQRTYLDRVRTSSAHLLGLINDVLDIARIEAGEMTVTQRSETTGPVVASAMALIAPQAAARDVHVVVETSGEEGVPYLGDQHRVRQILVNLLSNAVKFTDAGGTGLGLAISRQLARLMGGDLTVESRRGEGSTFTMWLPSVRAAIDAAAPEATAAGGAPARDVRAAPSVSGIPTIGLAAIGLALRDEVDTIVRACNARLVTDSATAVSRRLRTPELEDHMATLLADLAQSLVIVQDAGERVPDLLGDASEIQRTIASRHGVRRHSQGWTEDAVRREHAILAEEVERAVRGRVRIRSGDADEAIRVLGRLIARASEVSVAALREASRQES